MSTPHPPRWYRCTICSQSTQHAIVGNRMLSHWDVYRLPNEPPPVFSWRCAAHRRYKMRPASAMWASALGDLCSRLVCGHQAQWVCRDGWGYTQDTIERGLATGELQLDRLQRCYLCGDLESEDEHATGHHR